MLLSWLYPLNWLSKSFVRSASVAVTASSALVAAQAAALTRNSTGPDARDLEPTPAGFADSTNPGTAAKITSAEQANAAAMATPRGHALDARARTAKEIPGWLAASARLKAQAAGSRSRGADRTHRSAQTPRRKVTIAARPKHSSQRVVWREARPQRGRA